MLVSIVIPCFNEEKAIPPLHRELDRTAGLEKCDFEFLFVDDGSTDGTPLILKGLKEKDPRIRFLRLRRNFGQAGALQAGFDHSSGEVIITMDADLQDDPADIPRFLRTIEQGYDLVNGHRINRPEPYLSRILPSHIANWLIRHLSGIPLRDFGSTFKAYRRSILKDLNLQADLHRFIPVILSETGCRITEIPIHYRPRPFGKSKYSPSRILPVFLDLILLKFLISYLRRPLRIFGLVGVSAILPGLGLIGYTTATFFLKIKPPIHHGVLLLFATLAILVGIQFLTFGLLAEITSRIYLKIHHKIPYLLEPDGSMAPSSPQTHAP